MILLVMLSLILFSPITAADNANQSWNCQGMNIDRGNSDEKILYRIEVRNDDDGRAWYSQYASYLILLARYAELSPVVNDFDENGTKQKLQKANVIIELLQKGTAPAGQTMVQPIEIANDGTCTDRDGRKYMQDLSHSTNNYYHPYYRTERNTSFIPYKEIFSREEKEKIFSFLVRNGIKNGPRNIKGRQCIMCYFQEKDSDMHDFLKKEYDMLGDDGACACDLSQPEDKRDE